MREFLLCAIGQSNWQGAAKAEGGVVVKRTTSSTGLTDPFPGCNNTGQGGSCFPYLIDRMRARGINLTVLNYAIGDASVASYLGITGSTVSGGLASTPYSVGYMGGISLSGGSGRPVEGDPDFDPFTFLSHARAGIAAYVAANPGVYEKVIGAWLNGESDSGNGQAYYAASQKGIATYMLADGKVNAYFIGLTSKKPTATTADYVALQGGVAQAVSELSIAGNPVYSGADLFAWYGSNAPLYPENDASTRVHLTLRGQEVHAMLWDKKLAAAGC